jgi:hypothetical protein
MDVTDRERDVMDLMKLKDDAVQWRPLVSATINY